MYKIFIEMLMYKCKFPLGPISLFVRMPTQPKGSLALNLQINKYSRVLMSTPLEVSKGHMDSPR